MVRVGLVATYANWKGRTVSRRLGPAPRDRAAGPGLRRRRAYLYHRGLQFTREELERRAATNGLAGRVGFVLFQPDPADVYRMIDVAVHASTRPEPFGLTIVEAMGCGKPVVVAAAGGAAELFTPGHDGLGHTPGDVMGLTDAIARLAADPGLRAQLGRTPGGRPSSVFRKNGTGGRSQQSSSPASGTGSSLARRMGGGASPWDS